MAGVLSASFFEMSFALFLGLIGAALAVILLKSERKFLTFILCFLIFILGAWRFQNFAVCDKDRQALEMAAGQKEKAVLSGIVAERPEKNGNALKLIVAPDRWKSRIMVTANRYPEISYGDRIIIDGRLEEPQNFSGFNYRDYLAKDGICALSYFPEIEVIGGGEGNPALRFLFKFKDSLEANINRHLPVPHAGLMSSLIFGNEEEVPDTWKEKFNITGTRHIMAVSGMNITILSYFIFGAFLSLGLWRKHAFYASVFLVIAYVFLIGAPASAVRAAVMGILFLTAQHLGRTAEGIRPIIFSAALMVMFNPLILKADLGFQLSFLAVLGLVSLQPVFADFLKKVPDTFQLRYTLSASLAAQFFTFPILIYNFGTLSLIGPLVNIFIVPLLPLITILGIGLAAASFISSFLGHALSFPAWFLLTYILKIVDFSSQLPFAGLSVSVFPFYWVLVFYLILFLLVWEWQSARRLKALRE